MMKKDIARLENKIHRSTRLYKWNYGWAASYFITINTKKRQPYLGSFFENEFAISAIGRILVCEWLKTPLVRPDMNLVLDEYVVMPDHFHAIIHIELNKFNNELTAGLGSADEMEIMHAHAGNRVGPQRKNLASITRGFKGQVTKHGKKIDPDFGWQRSYYEKILRTEDDIRRVSQYIRDNPKNWRQ